MAILHPECKQSCNNQFSNNRLTVKGNQKISSKKPCINQARRVFTAKKIPDSCRKQEELKTAAGRASACLVPPAQLVTAVARAEGSERASPQPALPSCKQPRLESTHKSTCGTSKHLLVVNPWPPCDLSQVGFCSVSEKTAKMQVLRHARTRQDSGQCSLPGKVPSLQTVMK